ncbi:hypothetical protein [Halorubrum lipolyticum]|uniref:DUF8119 domain-containing protein n=1 Tax=Halorubrum lipolyticum DSM 21995 TaxID=1227482 RepID=M0P254_9EURY|nr:hypothetical protein [Halorubrum lipolyticum]EMA63923.1 hypothetical protein C469_02189 [Halorubrum lipolyticum DSM 21995]
MSDAEHIDEPDADESLADRVRSHVSENRGGMLYDLAFAVVWVTAVSLLYDFAFSSSPQWVLYMFMLAGIPAYFGFFMSLEMAKSGQ